MLCLKCGQEYEGKQCQRCEGPEILVNTSDYMARRKAYEERMKALSEGKDTNNKPVNRLSEVKKANNKKANNKKADNRKADNKKADDKRTDTKRAGRKNTNKKLIKRIVLFAVALCIVFLLSGIYKLSKRKNYVLYMSYNGKIYDVAGMESSMVCDIDKAVFAMDECTFYTPHFPDEITASDMLSSYASDKGSFFATVVYNKEKSMFSLYVWNEKECILVKESTLLPEIKYLTDDGLVIFTNSDVINDEGTIASTSLEVSKLVNDKKESERVKLIKLCGEVKKCFVYSHINKVIALDNLGSITVYDYEKDKSYVVTDEASGIIGMIEGEADGFIYSSNGNYYYYNISDMEGYRIAKTNNNSSEFIMDSKNKVIYQIVNREIYSLDVEKKSVGEPVRIDTISKEGNYIFISASGLLVYINSENDLCCLKNKEREIIENQVSDGSLNKVLNKSKALTFIKDNTQYYMENVSAKKIKLISSNDLNNTENTIFYKNRIYFYYSEYILYSNNLKGSELNKIGKVNRLWLGTQLK